MKPVFKCIIFFVSMFCFSSCATILCGTKQKVTITSNVPETNIYVGKFGQLNNAYMKQGSWRKLQNVQAGKIGVTPLTTKLDRNTELIFLEKEGYVDTLLYCVSKRVRIETVDSATGKITKKKIKPAKYYARTNGVTYLNLILGGLVGIIVDGATGSILRMDKKMDVELKPNK